MAIIGKLRERSGLVIILIGLSMLGFIATDLLSSRSALFGDSGPKGIGEILGEDIKPAEFQDLYQKYVTNELQGQGPNGRITPEIEGRANDQAWQVLITRKIIQTEAEKLGITVPPNEIMELIVGDNPHPITQYLPQPLRDPQTGQLDKQQLTQILNNPGNLSPEGQEFVANFTDALYEQRLQEKYFGIVKGGMFVTDLEAKEDFEARNKLASIQYVPLFTSSIPDSTVKVDDSEIRSYYDSHKEDYKREQSRTFEYAVFSFSATKEDTMAAEKWLSSKMESFQKAKNDSVYITRVGLSSFENKYLPRGSYPESLEPQIFAADSGAVIGPIYEDGKYKLVKVIGARQDSLYSMRASHILIKPIEGGTDKDTVDAYNKAKDIYNKIRGGADFAQLARENGQDGTASKGGDLGWFREGAMIDKFNDAVKNGKKGDLLLVQTKFGTHVIKVTEDKTKKLVKAGIIERAVEPGKATENEAFEKATKFATEASQEGEDKFTQATKKMNISPRIAEGIASSARDLPVLGNAREVIRWAYQQDRKVGDVSEPVRVGDNYIVAHLTKSFEEGYAPFEEIKDQVKVFAIAEKKKEMLAEKLRDAKKSGKTLEDIAKAVQSNVSSADNIKFQDPFIPNLNSEPMLVGAIFGSKPNVLNGPLKGENGVYMFKVTTVTGANAPPKMDADRKQVQQQQKATAENAAMAALRKLAEVKDYRYLYY
jgi:peptidyl-prolyl cis-trans isomerase D